MIEKTCPLNHVTGNHTIAVVKGKEEYEELKESLTNVINDVNSLIDDGGITVDGKTVKLEFYLGGDYKVNDSNIILTSIPFQLKARVSSIL